MSSYAQILADGDRHLQSGRSEEAVSCFRRAAASQPEQADPLFRLGLAYKQAGDLKQALPHLLKAMEMAPSVPLIRLHIGEIFYLLGRLDEGEREIEAGASQLQRILRDVQANTARLPRAEAARLLRECASLETVLAQARQMLGEVRFRQLFHRIAVAEPPEPGQVDPAAKPVRIAVLTCLWKRHALSARVLARYQAIRETLRGRVEVLLFAVGSEGDASRRIAEDHGFHYTEHANDPLGAKWNAGLAAIRGHDVDAVLIVGSDDLLDAGYFERCAAALQAGYTFIGLRDFYLFDLATLRLCYWPGYAEGSGRFGEPIGLGRCLHRVLLERSDWRLWEDALNAGLDSSMMQRLAQRYASDAATMRVAVLSCRTHGIPAVDVKSGENIWSFSQMIEGLGRVEYSEPISFFVERFPPPEAFALLALSSQVRQLIALAANPDTVATGVGVAIAA